MSGNKLGSLFSQSSQSNGQNNGDPLKFSAPKEPKRVNSSTSVLDSLEPAAIKAPQAKATASTSEPASAPTQASAPKVIASATVRLFKLSSAGAYEASEGGNPVGCVLMNSGTTAFNILVYNGQRVTLATSTIVPQFRYNIRDLYFSFTDISSGSSWSILFDQIEAMTTFVRSIATAVAFVCSHAGGDLAQSQKVVKLGLPTIKGSVDTAITLSTPGDTAGVYYTAWRVGGLEEAGSLLDIYKRTPMKEVPRSQDFEKIKVSSSAATAGGGLASALGDALLGSSKGERLLLCVPPTLLAPGEAQGAAWLIVEAEIVKVKLGGTNKDSTSVDNGKDQSVEPQQPVPGPPQSSPGGDLTARMAALASKGGAAKLPTAIPAQAQLQPQQVQTQQQQQLQPQPQQQASYRQQSPVRSQQPQQSQPPQQQQQYQPQQQPQQYAVAVVEGQGVRSYYDAPPPQQQQHPSHYDSGANNQVLQSVQSVQSAVQQVSSKLDQVQLQLMANAGATSQFQSTSGSASLQIQQQLQQLSQLVLQSSQQQQQHHHQPNMAPMQSFNPFQQQLGMGPLPALPYQFQQGQLQPLSQFSAGSSASGLRAKSQDVITLVQNLVAEHESTVAMLTQQHQQQLMQMQSLSQQSAFTHQQNALGVAANKETTSKLEEKVESLQARAEKLMDEKNALLAKQGELLQVSNDSQSKLTQAQAQIDSLQKDKATLEAEIEQLKQENASLTTKLSAQSDQAADSTSSEAKIKELMIDLEAAQRLVAERDEAAREQQTVHENALRSMQEESAAIKSTLSTQVADLTTQLEQLLLAREMMYDLLLPNDTGTNKEDRALNAVKDLLKAKANEKDSKIDSSTLDKMKGEYEGRLSTLQTQLDQQKEANAALEDDVKSLLEELDQLRVAAAATASAAAASGNGTSLNEETLRDLMQSVFVNTVEHFSADDGADKSYTLPQLQKGLRAVLKGITTERLSS